MNLLPSAEEQELADVARQVIADTYPLQRGVNEATARLDPAEWKMLADLGWLGLGIPEAAGGVGLDLAAEALLFFEMGRGALPGPLLGSVLAAHLLHAYGDGEMLARVLEGEATVGMLVAAVGAGDDDHLATDTTEATLVLGFGAHEVSVHPLSTVAAREPVPSLDPCTPIERLHGDLPAPLARVVGGDADSLIVTALVLAAAYQAGLADGCLAQSVAYAGEREQFGRPIGSFQAVKHRCADMAVRVEVARSMTLQAAAATGQPEHRRAFLANAAKALADEAATSNAAVNIQNHGAIGYTWEYGAHLMVSRAQVMSQQVRHTSRCYAELLAAPVDAVG